MSPEESKSILMESLPAREGGGALTEADALLTDVESEESAERDEGGAGEADSG